MGAHLFRHMPLPRLRGDDRPRYLLWPISFGRRPALAMMGRTFTWHGWHVRYEDVPVAKTSFGCMPGKRAVYGQTLHFGPLQVYMGPRPAPNPLAPPQAPVL